MVDLADAFGRHQELVAGFKPTATAFKALQDELVSRYEAHPGDATAGVSGRIWQVNLGLKENKRTITDPRKLFNLLKKLLGLDKVFELCCFRLSDVDSHVPLSEHPLFVSQARTGRRPVEAVLKAVASRAEAA